MSLGEQEYTFVIIKNPKQGRHEEPYLYFISDLQDAKAIAEHYLKRWKIECCFKNLKTNGFNIEDINVQSDKKIELMMGVLVLVYWIALEEGMLKHNRKPIPLKRYKNGKVHLTISIFRLGFAIIQNLFGRMNNLLEYIVNQLKPFTDMALKELEKCPC
ncbi:MAG: transposase [Bacteroidota bacterium]